MRRKSSAFVKIVLVILISVSMQESALNAVTLTGLKVEYSSTPIGIDVEKPRFSWQMAAEDNQRNVYQSAWQIIVTDKEGKITWDSRKNEGSVSIGIEYGGTPLKARTRYNWKVTVWDQSGLSNTSESWFETGLMNTGISAWSGAQWIGGRDEDLVLYSHYLSVFTVGYEIQLDRNSASTRASLILGANDNRLLDRNMNKFGISSPENGHYIKLELDISNVDGTETGLAKLNIYRVGYHPSDTPGKALFSLDIPSASVNDSNKYHSHQIRLESVFGTFTLFVNGTRLYAGGGEQQGRPAIGGGINVNPSGNGGDYIAFPMLADIGFSADAGQKASFSELTVLNYRKPSNILFKEDLSTEEYTGIFSETAGAPNGFSVTSGAYHLNAGKSGLLIVADPSRNSMPILRSEFPTKQGSIASARLYVTARGIYEMYLNGLRVGNDYFNPGLTQYNITHMYQTYDVTDMIVPGGRNAMGAMLGEGWWSGSYTFTGGNWNYFGDRQSLLAKLVITYSDGTEEIVTTNDREWSYFNKGPVVYGSFFQGEVYDARREDDIRGWNKAGFDDSRWPKPVQVPLEGTAFLGAITGMGGGGSLNYDRLSIVGQIGENAKIIKTITAQSIKEVRPGVFVYDMGQNMVGVPDITVKNAKGGETVRLRFAEVLYPDLEEYSGNVGMLMLENLRAAHVQDTWILKPGDNRIAPRFTFHGYRYVEITGLKEAPPPENVKGNVISSIHNLTADYKTSNEKVNRLWQNIVWSQYGNFLSIPTDCPQRNERMGWSGDLNVYSRTATYLANTDQFFRRHMIAMRDTQNERGRFGDVAPVGGGFGGLLWGSAGITVPWEAYLQYADVNLLREHYDAMAKYMDYLASTVSKETGLTSEAVLGDWLGPQNNQTGSAILVTAYHVFNLEIMTRVAEILEKNNDAEKWHAMYNERKDFFNKKFVNADHRTMGLIGGGGFGARGTGGTPELKLADTQSSYAVGLALGAFNDENIPYAAKYLAEACTRENRDDGGEIRPPYSLMTGFIGTAWISKALSDNGHSDIAYRLLQQTSYPSWLYPVEQGATSIWERLNSYTVENGFGGNNSMNSFNHYSFGAVGQWMIAYSLGIQRNEPGFKKFILQPEPDPAGQMTSADGYYESMYGRIESKWKTDGGTFIYRAVVPANTTAMLYLPASSVNKIRESGRKTNKAKGVTFVRYENGKALFELASGSYLFTTELQDQYFPLQDGR